MMKERLIQAMKGPPRITQAALARACGVTPQAVNAWLRGGSKGLSGANLITVARFLRVSPEWLATGKGPPRDESVKVGVESQSVILDPATMLRALRYLERRFAEAGQRYDPYVDTDLLCWAYEGESTEVAAPSNIIDFGRKLSERVEGGGIHASGRSRTADK